MKNRVNKKIHFRFKEQFESEKQAWEVLDMSFSDVIHSGIWVTGIVAVFELLMFLRLLAIKSSNTIHNAKYGACYLFLFIVSVAVSAFLSSCKKEQKKNRNLLYWIEVLYSLAITAWAVAITLLDAKESEHFEIIVFMTIMLIVPIISFVNPFILIAVQLAGDGIVLLEIIRRGDVALLINFSVYAIISIVACVAFHSTKKRMYVKQCEMQELACRDSLTGIKNRQKLREEGEEVWEDCMEKETQVSLIMMDIDYFKCINDRYGHLAGDRCIRTFADILKKACDRPEYSCYRYGGEEFVLLLSGTDRDTAETKIQEIVTKIQEAFALDEDKIQVTASFGSYTGEPSDIEDLEYFLAQADRLLYRAKENGRNCYFAE